MELVCEIVFCPKRFVSYGQGWSDLKVQRRVLADLPTYQTHQGLSWGPLGPGGPTYLPDLPGTGLSWGPEGKEALANQPTYQTYPGPLAQGLPSDLPTYLPDLPRAAGPWLCPTYLPDLPTYQMYTGPATSLKYSNKINSTRILKLQNSINLIFFKFFYSATFSSPASNRLFSAFHV